MRGSCEHPESLSYNCEFFLLLLLLTLARGCGHHVNLPLGIYLAWFLLREQALGVQTNGAKGKGADAAGRQRLKRRGHRRIALPSVILANSQYLRYKMDIPQAKVNFLSEYKDDRLIALTETWLQQQDPQSDLERTGFVEPLRLDRDPTVAGKPPGGGPCL